MKWTPDKVAGLRRLRALGLTAVECARALNTTKEAINGTCCKHGIAAHPWGDISPESLRAAMMVEWRESVRSVADGSDPIFNGGRQKYWQRIRELASMEATP